MLTVETVAPVSISALTVRPFRLMLVSLATPTRPAVASLCGVISC